ncbi:nucleotide pyrophosphohydrolase [Malaciobacter marinus]|jgi:NTP pyrophosphatase (non-canonical NTP hydrolase)|uniref:NTP pyrophosphatase (Non-canonical NTP hydrolase) n=1 Tax=Malaciobacter marinus TaxID=505249 RepID=A0AB36ZTP6_9BACT|nr:nucleotide pyrophosphohydrolase [Malaciobacter marinus]PPK59003.1 NTP pyrophosphatase (non-canonical NTP hydrolase) [Malaciobacter marinus]
MNMSKIQEIIKEFSKQRDWDKHHNPKNLAMALSVEVSELVEIFQWLDLEASKNLNNQKKEHLKEEIADIAVYLIRICMAYDINLEDAIFEKMKKNEEKYPLLDKNGNKIIYKKK